ncbi:MAG: single-stranded-DNA-specific exonuclease RecJ [Lachnospiraceae bacterium]|jgi:single-stranded-DNA-specific exonuclease
MAGKQREKWLLYSKKADFTGIAARYGIDPVIARIMRNRDVVGDDEIREYLQGDISSLNDPHRLLDADNAADLLLGAAEEGSGIAIASDFDVDGIFSGEILYEGLKAIGAKPRIFTPNRILEGYGLNERIVTQAYDAGCRTILTCDNGIAAFRPIELARRMGMTVIVTDHHAIPFEEIGGAKRCRLPEANAVVDPWQEDDLYPYKNLCGTGVAYKLIQILYERCGKPADEVCGFLDYAAIATVADVMPLDGENRVIVREGLKLLHKTRRPGLLALIKACSLTPEQIQSYHIGFILGPSFNASGRLATVETAFRLLQSGSEEEAAPYAADLRELNNERKDMTKEGTDRAIELIEGSDWRDDPVFLVDLGNSNESVSGIIAGRIREKYNRPVLVFANAKKKGLIKASGRSIEAWNMFEELSACRDLFEQFGGHAMAAGLTMKRENLGELRRRLLAQCRLTEDDLTPKVWIDCAMPFGYITQELVSQLDVLEPFGRGNEKPLFAVQHCRVCRLQRIGRNQDMLKMILEQNGVRIDALYFGNADDFIAFLNSEYGPGELALAFQGNGRGMDIAVTYYPQINEFQGKKSLQIVIQNYCRIGN